MKYPKNTFHKLYLIEKEMYDRILPQLNAVDKQEIVDLNKEHSPDYTVTEEPTLNEDDDVVEENIADNSVENTAETTTAEETPPAVIESNHIPVEKAPNVSRRIKRFACEVCVDKKFTTKYSLNRHKKNFHSSRQSVSKPEIQNKITTPVQSLKRKREEEDEHVTVYPVKKIRQQGPETLLPARGTKRKVLGKDLRPSKKFRWENF